MRRIHVLAGIFGILVVAGAAHWVHERGAKPVGEANDPLAAITEAERIGDPMQRCLAFPVPRGYRWPKAFVDAFCADALSSTLSWREIENAIDEGKAAQLDARLDALADGYFNHRVPEGVFHQAYVGNFRSSSAALDRVVEHWLDQVPNSAHALAARGISAVARASQSRGEDTTDNTPVRDLDKMRAALANARRDLEQALATNPRIVPAYVALLKVARLGGDDTLAQRTLDAALRVDPSGYFARAEFITGLEPRWGGSFEAMDRFADSVASQVAENPRLAVLRTTALAARGLPFYWDKDYRTALQHFERGLTEAADLFYLDVARYAAGQAGDDARAVELISQYLRFAPSEARMLGDRAFHLERLGRDEWAQADYAKALRTNPRSPKALRGYVNLLVKRNDDAAAETKLKELVAADPSDAWSTKTLAWLYVHRLHRNDEAMRLMDGLLARAPESGELWLFKLQLLDATPGSDMRSTVESFVRHADPSSKEQREMLPVAQKWLATHQDRGH